MKDVIETRDYIKNLYEADMRRKQNPHQDLDLSEVQARIIKEIDEGEEIFWKFMMVHAVKTYDPLKHQGETVFYGASNFSYWSVMEKDLYPYKVQNMAFGGSTDKDLVKWAECLLYPYHPKVVFFQTGSNDYVESPAPTDEEKIAECMTFKKKMFAAFHEQLPEAKFVVMSGLLLPGRAEYTELTKKVNCALKELCEQAEYMYYVDAEEFTYDEKDGTFAEEKFIEDGIHLTSEARAEWGKKYMLPLLEMFGAAKAD